MATCPICNQRNVLVSCKNCGADLSDPDVQALAAQTNMAEVQEPGEVGTLSSDRFLRVSLDGIVRGGGLGKLLLYGGVLMAAAFFAPVTEDYRRYEWPWRAAQHGPKLALLFPLIAGVLGILASLFVKSRALRAGLLSVLGVLGLAACVVPLGVYAGAPHLVMPLFLLGTTVCGAALFLRMLRPTIKEVRYAIIAGGVLVCASLLIPHAVTQDALFVEFRFFFRQELANTSVAVANWDGFGPYPIVMFLSWWGIVPFALFPLVALLAWRMPQEIWDKDSMALRPLAWLAVLYLPISYGLAMLNIAGWPSDALVRIGGRYTRFDDFSGALILARARLLLLSTLFVYWSQVGLVALYDRFRVTRSAPDA